MKTASPVRCLAVLVLCLSTTFVRAQEINLPYGGLILNAWLEKAPGKNLAEGIILITHGGLAHRDMEMIAYLRRLLKEEGYSTLSINLSLGVNQRHGMYDCLLTHHHQNEDAANEIGAWLAWLETQGARNVTLLGHSRGGAQTALYAARNTNPLVNGIVLMAPVTGENTGAATYLERYGKPLPPILEKARQLVEAGKKDEILENVGLMNCRDTPASVSAFLSYYGKDAHVDTLSLIPDIKKPLLVIVAGNDQVVPALDKKIAPLLDGKRLQIHVVESSDHLFRDLNSDDAVSAITGFIEAL